MFISNLIHLSFEDGKSSYLQLKPNIIKNTIFLIKINDDNN